MTYIVKVFAVSPPVEPTSAEEKPAGGQLHCIAQFFAGTQAFGIMRARKLCEFKGWAFHSVKIIPHMGLKALKKRADEGTPAMKLVQLHEELRVKYPVV